MRDFEIIKGNLHIDVCTNTNETEFILYVTAPVEVSLNAKEVGVSITLEDTLLDRAEHVWCIEGIYTDDLYEMAKSQGWNEYEAVDWGAGCLTTEHASQYEYLNEYVKEDEVHHFIEQWITRNLFIA